jgi:preprotein translocase subunit YajC
MEWLLLRSRTVQFVIVFAMLSVAVVGCAYGQGASASRADSRIVGTIKSIGDGALTLTPDSGGEVTATLSSSTKLLRVPPGEKDLKNATPLQVQDLQPGDRVLVRGQAAADGHSVAALAVIVMKQADLSAKQAHDRDDWQKRGVGGLVSAVDVSAGTISISASGFGGNHNITIHTTKDTITRRYAPDSVRFDTARPALLDQIKPGDQLRARGTRNADGSEVAAEEVVSGTFRNIAGTIQAIDVASNSMTVQDAIGKSSVVVKVSPDSQMKKLPPEMAQRIAMRLKGGAGQGGDANAEGGARPAEGGSAAGGRVQRGSGGMQGGNGPPDLQRFLSRMPNSALADLQKGDAVMIVATSGGNAGAVTAITLLAGVEPILTAAPNRSAAILSPWTLGGPSGEAESAP